MSSRAELRRANARPTQSKDAAEGAHPPKVSIALCPCPGIQKLEAGKLAAGGVVLGSPFRSGVVPLFHGGHAHGNRLAADQGTRSAVRR